MGPPASGTSAHQQGLGGPWSLSRRHDAAPRLPFRHRRFWSRHPQEADSPPAPHSQGPRPRWLRDKIHPPGSSVCCKPHGITHALGAGARSGLGRIYLVGFPGTSRATRSAPRCGRSPGSHFSCSSGSSYLLSARGDRDELRQPPQCFCSGELWGLPDRGRVGAGSARPQNGAEKGIWGILGGWQGVRRQLIAVVSRD